MTTPDAPALDLPAAPVPVVPDVRRLAVLRSGGLGDLLATEPALAALRTAYPDAELTLLGAPHHRALVEARPGPVDRFVPVPLVPGVRVGPDPDAPADEVDGWLAARRSEGYDLAVQMHGGGRHSNPFLFRLGARTTAGAATPDALKPDRWVPYAPYQHDTLRWLEVAAACGAPAVRLEPHLAVTDRDRRASYAVLPPTGRPLVAVHPGATDARRRWPAERLAAVAAGVAERGGGVVVLGSEADREDAAAVLAALPGRAVDLVGRLDLPGLVGLLSRAALFLGNDSGPRWIAQAVGTPTVAVFTSANLADVAPLTRTWHRMTVSWGSRCASCGLGVVEGWCGHGVTALADVPVTEVLPMALDLWEQARAAGRLHRDPMLSPLAVG